MQDFSNYLVQILVIRAKCQGGKGDLREAKKILGEQLPPTFRAYELGCRKSGGK